MTFAKPWFIDIVTEHPDVSLLWAQGERQQVENILRGACESAVKQQALLMEVLQERKAVEMEAAMDHEATRE